MAEAGISEREAEAVVQANLTKEQRDALEDAVARQMARRTREANQRKREAEHEGREIARAIGKAWVGEGGEEG